MPENHNFTLVFVFAASLLLNIQRTDGKSLHPSRAEGESEAGPLQRSNLVAVKLTCTVRNVSM